MTMPPGVKVQLIAEIGDPNTSLDTLCDTLWTAWQLPTAGDDVLRQLYCKRSLLDVRLAEEQTFTDVELGDGLADKQGQRFLHLQDMRDRAEADIVARTAQLAGSRGPVSGVLRTTAPVTPSDPNMPDANDQRYMGTPYRWRP